MASFSLSIKYRPLRIGFCVAENKVEDLLEVARLNTLLAGGVYNVIIPVGKDNEYAESLIKLYKLDLLYPVSNDKRITKFIEQHKNLKSFELENRFIWSTDQGWTDGQGQNRLRVLDVIFGLEKYVSRSHRKILNPQWKEDDPLATLFSLQYGLFPTGNHLYNLPNTFKQPFYEKPMQISSEKSLDLGLVKNPVPINISVLGSDLWGNSPGWNYDGFYLGDHDNFEDLVNFWNLRASGLDMVFIPFKYATQYSDIAKFQLKVTKERDSRRKFPRGVGCWYLLSVSEEIINVVINELGVSPEDLRNRDRIDEAIWNGLNLRPSKPILSTKTVMANVDWKYEAPRISFELPDVPTLSSGGYQPAQHFCLSVNPITEFEYDGYTLKLPYLTDMNEWYSREAMYSPYDVRIEPDAISVIVDTHDSVKNLYPVKQEQLLRQLFVRAGIEAKDSQAGLIARKLVEQMGGLDSCRVFKIPGVRKLIASLNSTDFTTRSNAVNVIRDLDESTGVASFTEHESLHIQARETPKLSTDEAFSYMLSKKLFRAGLEMTCSNCKLKPWLSINSLGSEVTCEYCGGQVELVTQLKDRDWKFRKSGLIGSDNNQEGAIPVILTLLQFLHRDHSGGSFVYSTALKLDSKKLGIDCETDFAALGHTRDIHGKDYTAVAIGEVKSLKEEINDQDIENLSKVKEALDKSGVKTYLVFAKTADFTDAEIQRFKDLQAKGISPILFTCKELDPYELYDYYRKNDIELPRKYGSSFEDMAQNSATIYLS